jgi:hypothetical protein
MRALPLVLRRSPRVPVWQQRSVSMRPQLNLALQIVARGVRLHTMTATTVLVSIPERRHVAAPPLPSRHSALAPARPVATAATAPVMAKTPVMARQAWPDRRVALVRKPVMGERTPAQHTDRRSPPVRVLRQTGAAATAASMARAVPTVDALSPVMRRGAAAAGDTPATTTAVPVDLRALTDQVIRTIDQRIAAQRERMGRI